MRHFSPDARNVGGRRTIVGIIKNHHKRLCSVGPEISTTFRPMSKTNQFKSRKSSKLETIPDLSAKLSRHRKIKLGSSLESHMRNIENLQRRIQDYASPREREKHAWDPLCYPVMFLRGNREAQTMKLNVNFVKKMLRPPKSSKVFRNLILQHSPRTTDELNKIGNHLIEVITDNRLYKDIEIQELFEQTKNEYSHLEPELLERVFSSVRRKLET